MLDRRRLSERLSRMAKALADLVFGEQVDAALSARVRRRIEQLQEASEIIVSWTQASAIVFVAVVYAVSPKAFPPDTQFEPVPWTLGVYAAFTTARIVLAHRRKLRTGFVAASVVIDIAVLMITIWSFHRQYQAPPALYLKAPTLMYVFILIALRTLRFEPRFVVLAGGCSALGWFILFANAATGPAADFTHSYVDYATSYKILRGAEIDKILSILMVTAILALSLVRARKLLISSVAEAVAAGDFSRFFAPEVAEQIRRVELDPTTGQGVRRDAAVLSTDLRGFTQLSSSLPPQELIALLGEYHARIVPVIQRHHGSIDKYLGDGILASFGAVVSNKRSAADLCRAMEELAIDAQHWQQERESRGLPAPAVAIAGAAGEVVFGITGHETRLEYTVIGDVVNLVTRLEKHTKREAVWALTTRQSLALAVAQGFRPGQSTRDLPARLVDGVDGPVDLVALAI